MIVAHNLSALNTIRSLNTNNRNMSCSLERLATGYKINSGSDDPSGLVISEQLRAQTAGLKRAVQNTQEANNMLGIAEGALNEMSNMLKKMKQLAVHSANNGVTSPEQIGADQAEIDSSIQTIDRIARTTKYSDQNLLNGNKEIEFDTHTNVNSTSDNPLLDKEMSELYQIPSFNRNVTISFNGTDKESDADLTNEARKAYFELNSADNRLDITANAEGLKVLSKDQAFSIRGSKGSREFSFAAGTTIGEINSTLNSASESIGLDSSIIFDSSQSVDMIAYTTTAVNTIGTVTTDGNAGNIPIFNAVSGVTGMSNNITINANDQVTGFEVTATDVGLNQVRFDMVDSLGSVIGTQTRTLNSTGVAANDSIAVSLASANGTSINFDYNFGHSGPQAAAVTNNGVQTAGSGGSIPTVNSVTGVQNMTALTINPADQNGNAWSISQSTVDANTVRFTLTDGITTQTQDVSRTFAGGISNPSQNVVITTGNGTTCSFDYNFEEDSNKGAWDHIADGNIANFDNTGAITGTSAAVTDGPSAGNVTAPHDPTVDAAQNVSTAISILDSNSSNTSINVTASTTANPNEVLFTYTGDSSGVLGTQTITLNNLATAGTGSQAISYTTANGSTIDFDYYYDNDPGTGVFDRPTGSLLDLGFGTVPYDRPDGTLFTFNATSGASANSGGTTDGTYVASTPAVTGLDALATLDNDDQIGNSWTVSSNIIDSDTVRFSLTDNTGTRSGSFDLDMTRLGDIGVGSDSVTVLTANGSSVSFNWGYENDPNKVAVGPNGSYDTIGSTVLSRYNYTSNRTYLNGSTTNGPNALNTTSPSPSVPAVQNVLSQINIFDVVNGETPFDITAAAGAGASEIVFTVHGATTDPLLTETVSLAAFSQAATGYQAISLETPNGSTIEFDYYYENDPTTGEYDRPVGDLLTVDATPVDSERLFNGLSKDALTAGASIDINLDPATGTHVQNLEYGRNTDGQGRMFIKVVEHNLATQHIEFEVYKDESYTASSLIGFGGGSSDGTTAISISAMNQSNLQGEITFDDAGGTIDFTDSNNIGEKTYVGIGGIWGTNGVTYEGGFATASAALQKEFAIEESVFSGVELGKNTDDSGRLYYRTVQDGANSGQVFAYKNEAMRDEDLVAMSYTGVDLSADSEVVLNSVSDSGLGIILRTGDTDWDGTAGDIATATSRFENIGVRISADEYGSKSGLTIKQNAGQCWEYYSDPADSEATIVQADNDSYTVNGADAVVNINGTNKTCDGLELDLATLEMTGKFVFEEGKVGATTVAQVGYSAGSVFTNAGFLTDTQDGWVDSNNDGKRDPDEITTFKAGANLVNAGHNTTETLGGFTGGMQLQLGEGAGGQERTILGLCAMTSIDLGKIKEDDGSVITLNDILSGGLASLGNDPLKAMEIINQAINDVANTRARIGAWQSNLLETNANSLNVAIENITKTESYIRDADMAKESTQFSKNQIMVQAATSMLSQANSMSQSVLSLLG